MGGSVNEPVLLEYVQLDDGAPASLYEDDRGAVIGVDPRDPHRALQAVVALISDRFASKAWTRTRGECGAN